MQIDSVTQADSDETTHLTNTKVTSSNINQMRHIINEENRPRDKERDKPPLPSKNPTDPKNLKHECPLLGIA